MRLTNAQKASIAEIMKLTERLRALASVTGRKRRGMFIEAQAAWGPANWVTEVVREYQRFLTMRVLHPDKLIRPDTTVDDLWHAHILDTRAYAADCQAIFGAFLHHDPSIVDGSHDAEAAELYKATFTKSAWGKPVAVLEELMYGPNRPARRNHAGCETCG